MSLLNLKDILDTKALVETLTTTVNGVVSTLSNHTSSLASILARTDANTSTRLSSTDPRLNNLDSSIAGIPTSPINQIVTLTVTGISATPQTIVIPSVSQTKSVVLCQAYYTVNVGSPVAAGGVLLSDTQLQVTGTSGAQAHFTIIEFK